MPECEKCHKLTAKRVRYEGKMLCVNCINEARILKYGMVSKMRLGGQKRERKTTDVG